jgi:hypothetical protein
VLWGPGYRPIAECIERARDTNEDNRDLQYETEARTRDISERESHESRITKLFMASTRGLIALRAGNPGPSPEVIWQGRIVIDSHCIALPWDLGRTCNGMLPESEGETMRPE